MQWPVLVLRVSAAEIRYKRFGGVLRKGTRRSRPPPFPRGEFPHPLRRHLSHIGEFIREIPDNDSSPARYDGQAL